MQHIYKRFIRYKWVKKFKKTRNDSHGNSGPEKD